MKDYTICAYMRLSNEDRDIFGRKAESGSITSQRRLIMDFINRQPEFKGCSVIERCDDGLSGRYFDNRPQFMDMIERTKQGRINCIIVKACSRFGRDYVELGDYLEQLFPFLGVRFIAINDHYDSDTCEGGLDIAFKNLVYDIYARDTSKKIREMRQHMARQGKYFATQPLYGYKKMKGDVHKLEIDPDAAAVVREIFDMRLAEMGTTEIARNLNERGVKCQSMYRYEKGLPSVHDANGARFCWLGSTVEHVLRDETYTGTVVSLRTSCDRMTGKPRMNPREEWIRVEGMHEAIVSKEDFDKIQETFQSRNISPVKRKIHYSCGICGKRLVPSRKTLYCQRKYVHGEECECRQVKAKEEYLDGLVLADLKKWLQRVMDAEEMKLKAGGGKPDEADRIGALENTVESVKKAKQALFEKLADRSIDRERFKEQKKGYDEEIVELEQRISGARVAQRLVSEADAESREKIEAAKSFLDKDEMDEEMWDKFMEYVLVYPDDRMEIKWSFEE